jgi:hypothetical protein
VLLYNYVLFCVFSAGLSALCILGEAHKLNLDRLLVRLHFTNFSANEVYGTYVVCVKRLIDRAREAMIHGYHSFIHCMNTCMRLSPSGLGMPPADGAGGGLPGI